ncbi:MAG: NAD(P)H-dependent dehydrogenase/reductase [Desulfuromonadales bacterium]|nr:NAD(P)H-dependent dehydrogenase/reductase [Desulfuromonadales bacterium]
MLSLLQKRRSIRRFKSRPIEQEKVEALIEALLRSPSSRNLDPWEFVVIDDQEMLQKVGQAKEHGSNFIAGAPLAIAVIADPQRCDVWIEDCSIAAIILQLMAESLGLGSCWAQIRLRPHDAHTSAEDYLKELLDLPRGCKVEAVIGIGYPDEQKAGHPVESLQRDKVHWNRYGAER